MRRRTFVLLGTLALAALGCDDHGKKSEEAARDQAKHIATLAEADVQELRNGLPEGAPLLVPLLKDAHPEPPNYEKALLALEKTRDKVPDLRVAKSTFFAVASPEGRIWRRDGATDPMAGKFLFEAYPGLKGASTGTVEARGSLPEAAGVRGRYDEQWVMGSPIRDGERTLGLYVSGWSWSSYAYRLETALRSEMLTGAKVGDNIPLVYVYVAVGSHVFGAPISPEFSAKKLEALGLPKKSKPGEVFSQTLEIDGRWFGVASVPLQALEDVAVCVLRSET